MRIETIGNHDYLICLDSDGTVMDTMDIKHKTAFGPCLIAEWELEMWQEEILHRWNDINLYTMTRGINRYKGLAAILQEVERQYTKIADLDSLVSWTQQTPELSAGSLKQAIRDTQSLSLKKALSWSESVDKKISTIHSDDKTTFPKVSEVLKIVKSYLDIVVVSSANLQAITEEWSSNGVLQYIDAILSQEMGSKSVCLKQLLNNGYDGTHVLMVGDAPGDLQAARESGTLFFPILVKHEKESWEEFLNVAVKKLINGNFSGSYQEELIDQFYKNLSVNQV